MEKQFIFIRTDQLSNRVLNGANTFTKSTDVIGFVSDAWLSLFCCLTNPCQKTPGFRSLCYRKWWLRSHFDRSGSSKRCQVEQHDYTTVRDANGMVSWASLLKSISTFAHRCVRAVIVSVSEIVYLLLANIATKIARKIAFWSWHQYSLALAIVSGRKQCQ